MIGILKTMDGQWWSFFFWRNAWCLTPIQTLFTWTNNVRDIRESVVGALFFNNIIGPRRQGWDESGTPSIFFFDK
jgi:hypothetical protein